MTPKQIKETAKYIYEEYYYFKLDDIYLIFTRIKKGEFGELFESLDGSKILKFFKMYANERANIYENESINQSDKQKYQDEKMKYKRQTKKI